MQTTTDTAMRNDRLRAHVPFVSKPDLFVLSRGVAELPPDEIAAIAESVRAFNAFKLS